MSLGFSVICLSAIASGKGGSSVVYLAQCFPQRALMKQDHLHLKLKPSLIALCAVVALEIAIRPLMPADPTLRIAATGVLRIIEAFALIWWVSLLPNGLTAIGLNKENWLRGLKTGLIWSVVFALVAVLSGGIIYYGFNTDPRSLIRVEIPKGLAAGGVILLVAGLLSPIAEEIFFRGILYSALRNWGAAVAITGSTALFAGAHTGSGFPFIQCIGGMVFACAREQTRSLIASSTIHILANMAIYGIGILSG